MKKLYLSGPMTNKPDNNIPVFTDAAEQLRDVGFIVLSPAETDNGDMSKTREYYLRKDVRMISEADGLAMIDGWETSAGAQFEVSIARMLKLPIHTVDEWTDGLYPLDNHLADLPRYVAPDSTKLADWEVDPTFRVFETGATRDVDNTKPDYAGFLSSLSLERYGKYMTEKRKMPDGSTRASDNWKKGIPRKQYVKSMLRHVVEVVKTVHDGIPGVDPEESLSAIIFNAQGLLHEILTGGNAKDAVRD